MSYLNISSPGKYWLEVSDFDGCKGKDTINVSLNQDCENIIYFPSGFTPNNDGRNDIFKPTAKAPLEIYQLAIFNRWGQKIFQTNDILQGWNGFYKNNIADNGTYIWQAIYKFYNEATKSEKGTIVLIK